MGFLNNYLHLLPLTLLAVFINSSWTENIKANEDLLHDTLQNNNKDRENPTGKILKQIDQRISDVIAENVLHFGHNVGIELAALDPNATKNEIFSPVSLMAALSLLTLGAKNRSYDELKQILGIDSDSELISNPNKYHEEFGLMLNDLQHTNVSSGVYKRPNADWRYTTAKYNPIANSRRSKGPVEHIIKIANGLFVQNDYTLNPDYSQVLKSIYETEFTQLDLHSRNSEARNYINAWVDKATFGKIPEIIKDEIDKRTNVILASTLYFKAFWQTQFFSGSTRNLNFYPDGLSNPAIKVPMMATGGVFPSYDAKEYDCRIIGLPYKGNQTTMYVIQPNNSSRQKLRGLQRVLDAHKINGMINKMQRKTTVMLFPKMHFKRSMHMKKILENMNVHDIFVNGYSDLSLIGHSPPTNCAGQSPPERTVIESVPVSFASIYRKKPVSQSFQFVDKYNEPALVFTTRLGEIENSVSQNEMLSQTEKSTTTVSKQIIKREKRQVFNYSSDTDSLALWNLESHRQKPDFYKSDLYVDDVLHNVDFSVDEQGTEAAAATVTLLQRSGSDVIFRAETPFLIIIRHDPTKLPLFYGIINMPEL